MSDKVKTPAKHRTISIRMPAKMHGYVYHESWSRHESVGKFIRDMIEERMKKEGKLQDD